MNPFNFLQVINEIIPQIVMYFCSMPSKYVANVNPWVIWMSLHNSTRIKGLLFIIFKSLLPLGNPKYTCIHNLINYGLVYYQLVPIFFNEWTWLAIKANIPMIIHTFPQKNMFIEPLSTLTLCRFFKCIHVDCLKYLASKTFFIILASMRSIKMLRFLLFCNSHHKHQ